MQENIITKEKKKELQQELKHLIEVDRMDVIQEIKEARGHGDLSENAEYDSARDKQARIEDRIREIERILSSSKIISATKSVSSKVKLGSEVSIKNLKTSETDKYIIVGSLEANPFENKISNLSPLGKALIGKELNEVVKVEASPAYEVKITKIS